MSNTYSAWCDTCQNPGPELRRNPGGVTLIDEDTWQTFLIEHTWHRIELRTED
jgi:hypothetical protein